VDIQNGIIERAKFLEVAKTRRDIQQYCIEYVHKDVTYFFNDFLWTYDPRRQIKIIPFVLYPFQIDFLECLNECYKKREHLLVEKSRDMGFSWLCLGFILWKMITTKGFSAGVGSYKMELVDELDNMKALIPRLRFMLNYLPPWLRSSYNERKHSKHGIVNIPNMGSTVTGEAGDNIGRGDRKSLYLIDEFAHVPRSSAVQEAISQTTDFRIYGSTPKGRGNEFARLRWKTNIKRFTMHWKMHPLKDEKWYEKQKLDLTEEQIAQELDISYTKSQKGKVYKWFVANKHANESIPYNPNYLVDITCDWGIGDPTAVVFLQYYNNIIHVIDYFEQSDTEISEIFRKIDYRLKKFDPYLSVNKLACIYGDPDGRNRNIITGTSIANFISKKYGIKLRYKLPDWIKNRILSVRMLGVSGRIKIDKNLNLFIECIENYVYPEKDSGENEKPLHNWASHGCTALERYVVYHHGMDQNKKDVQITEVRFR
jgi:hypothetical protein